MCAREDDPSQHDYKKTFEGTPYPDPVTWSPEIVVAGIREAIEHGHPSWSHAFAYGPCTKPSKFGVLEIKDRDEPVVIEDPEDLEDTLVGFAKYLEREEFIQGSIDPDGLLKEIAHEFLALRPEAKKAVVGRKAYVVQAPNYPTFYLLADVQGLMSVEAAKRVARDILGSSQAHVQETTLP